MLEMCVISTSNFDTYRHIDATPFSHHIVAVSVPLASNLNEHSENSNHYLQSLRYNTISIYVR